MKGIAYIPIPGILALVVAATICNVGAQNCGSMPNNSVLAGDKCYDFLHCSNGIITMMKCNQYYKFNSVTGKCDYSPDCVQGDVVDPGSENPCYNAADGVLKKSSISCKYYYYCFKGVSILQSCADGWGFNPDDQLCVKNFKCIP